MYLSLKIELLTGWNGFTFGINLKLIVIWIITTAIVLTVVNIIQIRNYAKITMAIIWTKIHFVWDVYDPVRGL